MQIAHRRVTCPVGLVSRWAERGAAWRCSRQCTRNPAANRHCLLCRPEQGDGEGLEVGAQVPAPSSLTAARTAEPARGPGAKGTACAAGVGGCQEGL